VGLVVFVGFYLYSLRPPAAYEASGELSVAPPPVSAEALAQLEKGVFEPALLTRLAELAGQRHEVPAGLELAAGVRFQGPVDGRFKLSCRNSDQGAALAVCKEVLRAAVATAPTSLAGGAASTTPVLSQRIDALERFVRTHPERFASPAANTAKGKPATDTGELQGYLGGIRGAPRVPPAEKPVVSIRASVAVPVTAATALGATRSTILTVGALGATFALVFSLLVEWLSGTRRSPLPASAPLEVEHHSLSFEAPGADNRSREPALRPSPPPPPPTSSAPPPPFTPVPPPTSSAPPPPFTPVPPPTSSAPPPPFTPVPPPAPRTPTKAVVIVPTVSVTPPPVAPAMAKSLSPSPATSVPATRRTPASPVPAAPTAPDSVAPVPTRPQGSRYVHPTSSGSESGSRSDGTDTKGPNTILPPPSAPAHSGSSASRAAAQRAVMYEQSNLDGRLVVPHVAPSRTTQVLGSPTATEPPGSSQAFRSSSGSQATRYSFVTTPPPVGGEPVKPYDVAPDWRPDPRLDPAPCRELCRELYAFGVEHCFVMGITSVPNLANEKSEFAGSVSLALAANGHARVLLVDASFDRPMQHELMRVDMPPGESFSRQIQGRMLGRIGEHWSVLRCSKGLHLLVDASDHVPGLILSRSFETCIRALRTYYDFVVIDGPTGAQEAECRALDGVIDGLVVVCTEDTRASIPGTSRHFTMKRFSKAIRAIR